MISEAYKINRIEPDSLTPAVIQNLYAADSRIVEKYGFLKQFRNANEYKDLFLSTFTGGEKELFIIKNQSLICGILSFIKGADWSGKVRYELAIRLGDLEISKPLIECLSQFIDEKLTKHHQFAIITYNNELEALIQNHVAKIDKNANTYTLDREDINLDLLNKAINEYQVKNSDLNMIYTNIISEEYIEQYCDLFMETMTDMPDRSEEGYVPYVITPEKQRQHNEANIKNHTTHHCYMIYNESNMMIGKTNVSVNNKDPRFPYQFMIGIKSEYRGRSLGKWLYASMYKKLFENVAFEKVLIHHHPKNEHAIAISEWIGYKFRYLETLYVVRSSCDKSL